MKCQEYGHSKSYCAHPSRCVRCQVSPLIKYNGNLAISDLEKANLFGEHLAKIFSPHDDIIITLEHNQSIENFLDSPFLFHYQQNIQPQMN